MTTEELRKIAVMAEDMGVEVSVVPNGLWLESLGPEMGECVVPWDALERAGETVVELVRLHMFHVHEPRGGVVSS